MITIHAGHNKPGKPGCGASDWIDESREARILVKKICNLLKKAKINYKNITVNNGTSQNDVLQKLVKRANNCNRDIDISIHFNSFKNSTKDGKTMGVECLVHPTANKRTLKLANNICNTISSIGFNNRHVKYRDDLYFINKSNRPVILIEVCFVTDADDASLYLKNKNNVAKAIASAINSFYA